MQMVKRAIELGGTCTGEHGVGVGKRRYLNQELGEGTVNLMKDIKRLLDPQGIMNPGKVCRPHEGDKGCPAFSHKLNPLSAAALP